MNVLISDKVDPGCVEILRQGGIEVDVNTGLSPDQLLEAIPQYEGLIVRSSTKVTEEVIKAAGRLQVVGRAGTGFDNIDVDAATRHGVIVMNTPGGNSVSTAELTFAMLMSLARNIPQGTASLKSGKWERSAYTGVELAGKTLGVMGLGKVGREVAARASAFKMRVLGYDPYISEDAIVSYGTRPASLDEIYAQADFITVHLHLTEQTRHYVSDEQLSSCKDGVFVLNCARGGIVDEADLAECLRDGVIAGAALDVFDVEPPPQDHPLVKLNRGRVGPSFFDAKHAFVANHPDAMIMRRGNRTGQAHRGSTTREKQCRDRKIDRPLRAGLVGNCLG